MPIFPSWLHAFLPQRWSPECWSLPYLKDRLRVRAYQKQNPTAPWLTEDAIAYLQNVIKNTDQVVEFGSGRSTIYFATRAGHVLSYESNPEWFERVNTMIADAHLANVDQRLFTDTQFATDVCSFPEHAFDLALIDGNLRAQCALNCIPRLKPGGLMVIDNVNRHIPNQSRGPGSLREWNADGADTELWKTYVDKTKAWEQVWTTNGVWDTLIQIKPV